MWSWTLVSCSLLRIRTEPLAMQANVVVVFLPLINIHPKGRATAHNYSKIYVLKYQSGHKTVKEVWNFGSMVVW